MHLIAIRVKMHAITSDSEFIILSHGRSLIQKVGNKHYLDKNDSPNSFLNSKTLNHQKWNSSL